MNEVGSVLASRSSEAPSGLWADPMASANVYCEGCLDPLIHGALVPFWQRFRQEQGAEACRLWFMRYGRCGEHLKIRIHGPEALRHLAEQQLSRAVSEFFADLPASSREATRRSGSEPPIDVEDEATEPYPDRTLVWTRYRRSPITLGGEIHYRKDRYTELFTTCLAAACEEVLEHLEPRGANGEVIPQQRQNAFVRMIAEGLGAISLSRESRSTYLEYHRDTSLRVLAALNADNRAGVASILEQIGGRVARMATTVETLERVLDDAWTTRKPADEPTSTAAVWPDALDSFYRYVVPFYDDPAYHLDEMAPNPSLSPLVKIFQAIANQLGLTLLDEAFMLHLLRCAMTPDQSAELSADLTFTKLGIDAA